MNDLDIQRRRLLAVSALVATGQTRAANMPAVDQTWRDAARNRDVPVLVRWPSGSGPWPVIVYSHGLGGSREGGDAWGQAWQAAGYVVLHLQHPGSDIEVLRNGVDRLREAGNLQQFLVRMADVRFAIDEVERRHRLGTSPWSQVRMASIGVAGHSFGAMTTLAVAGQRFDAPSTFADARVAAFIAFSPGQGRSKMPLAEQFGAIKAPFLVVTGSLDGDPFGSYESGEPRAKVYEGLPAGQRALLWLDGADHMSFAGNAAQRINCCGPFKRQPIAAEREVAHHALVARITTHWWQEHLMADAVARETARAALRQPQGLRDADRLTLG